MNLVNEINFELNPLFHSGEFNIDDSLFEIIKPKPASKYLPDWYKDLSILNDKNVDNCPHLNQKNKNVLGFLGKNDAQNLSMKACMPVFDYLSHGYIIPTFNDIIFFKNNNELNYKTNINIIDMHPVSQVTTLINQTNFLFSNMYGDFDKIDYEKIKFLKYLNPWSIKTTNGVSCLFLTPFYHDNRIKIFAGVVDTDTYSDNINFPFLINLKNNEQYVLKIGTPLVHVIPFVRGNFTSKIIKKTFGINNMSVIMLLKNFYKKFHRKRKKFL